MFRKISQNIKKIWNFLYFEKSNKSIFFVPKIVHMTISIKIGSNFPLNYRILPVFLNSLLIQFLWNVRFRKFVVLSLCQNFDSKIESLLRNFLHISQTTLYWAHFTGHMLLITFYWSHFTGPILLNKCFTLDRFLSVSAYSAV